MDCKQLTDKEQITDLLCAEKYLTSVYNTYACEAATPAVKSCLLNTLTETHRMQEELFTEMSTRGWYPTEKAEETKINQAKQQYSVKV